MVRDEEDDDTLPDVDIYVSSSAKGYPFSPPSTEEVDSDGKTPDGEVASRSHNDRHDSARLPTDKKDDEVAQEKEKDEEEMELLCGVDDDSVKTKEPEVQSESSQRTRRLLKAEKVKQKIDSLQARLTAPL